MTAARPQSNNSFSPPVSTRMDGPYRCVSAGGPPPEPRTTIFKGGFDGDGSDGCATQDRDIARRAINARMVPIILVGWTRTSIPYASETIDRR